MIIVGSRALRDKLREVGHFAFRVCVDTDVWSDQPMDRKVAGLDFTLIPSEILNLFSEETKKTRVASLEDLLAIKMSHFGWDIFWKKHKQDILLIKKFTKGKYNERLYLALKEYWKGIHGRKDFLSLYKDKDAFFDDFVPKQYEHDYLHELVAFPDPPLYISCLKEGHDVFIDSSKWQSLPRERKIRMMKEEIAVIALERWLIPTLSKQKNVFTIQQAWNKSLHKTVTRLTKGIFCDFMVENIEEFLFPLEKEILYVLSRLNLKEIYMSNTITLDDFTSLVNEALLSEGESPRWDDKWSDVDILMGDFPENSRVEFIKREGGGEGGSEDCYSVIKVDGVFYKVYYNYFSHYGFCTEYADVRVVTPKEKTIIVYE